MVFCLVWFLQIILTSLSENSTVLEASGSRPWSGLDPGLGSIVWHVSVPEEHHLCLPCGLPQDLNWTWTHGDHKVPPQRQDRGQDRDQDRDQDQDQDLWRFNVRPDGTLCVLKLEPSDSGQFFCNRRLRVDLQVLTGRFFSVSVGRTLLLPCRVWSKPRQRWFWRRTGSRRELVLTRSRDGTVKVEREDGRLGFEHDALRILDLQPSDAGEYECNGERLGTVAVETEPEPTPNQRTVGGSSVTPVVKETDFVEKKPKEKKPENVLLIAIVVGLGLMVVMTTVVCVLLTSIKCRRKRRRRRAGAEERPEATELQPWTTAHKHNERNGVSCSSPEEEEEEIHYASLGRPTWKHRPTRTPAEPEHHSVIYSSICTNK